MTITAPPVTIPGSRQALPAMRPATPVLDVVIPVHNEQDALARCIRRLDAYLCVQFPFAYRITIADNASTDSTLEIAHKLESVFECVRVVHLDLKGRGRALHAVWSASDATVVAYMDVDLSTDLNALLPLVAPLLSGHSDLAIGTRLAPGSRVVRGPKREFISRSYNLILRRTLHARFSDAQCGFKAMRADVAAALLPLVEDTGWFFDTELLVLAERSHLRISEVPVDWTDDPDSSVDIIATAIADLKGVARIRRALATGTPPLAGIREQYGRRTLDHGPAASGRTLRQAFGFAGVGAFSTVAYAVLYLTMRAPLGAQSANVSALLITALANTAANRRFTFKLAGRASGRDHSLGLAIFGVGLALTSGALATLHALVADPSRSVEVGVLILASAAATAVRFVAFRRWVFPQPVAS